MANERYDEGGRWVGSINFAGQIFKSMRNYTANNRATSIGSQLLTNYRQGPRPSYSGVHIDLTPGRYLIQSHYLLPFGRA